MDDTPRIRGLRLALASGYADSNSAVNEVLVEVGPGRGGLTQLALAMGDLLDELVGAERIQAALTEELDGVAGPAA